MHRYFVTVCTNGRRPIFKSAQLVGSVLQRLAESARVEGFSNYAYCFMPDHLHVLLVATRDDASLTRCVERFKKTSAFDFRLSGRLWQRGYHEHVLRSDQATMTVARYILENPVRAGLTRTFQDYPFSGSQEFTTAELVDLWGRV